MNDQLPPVLREALENYDKNEHPYHYAARCMAAALRSIIPPLEQDGGLRVVRWIDPTEVLDLVDTLEQEARNGDSVS